MACEQLVSASDREKAFRDAIADVCLVHGAELQVTDDGKSYGMHNGVLRVTMMSVWNDDVLMNDFCEFDW